MVQNHEKCAPGVEKNEVEKKRGFFPEKSHAVVRGCPRDGGGSALYKYPPGSLCEAGQALRGLSDTL